MNIAEFWTTAQPILIHGAFQVAAAIAFWVVGTWLINLAVRVLSAALERQKVEPTIEKGADLIPSIRAPESSCVKSTLHEPQLRRRVNMKKQQKIQMVNDADKIDISIADLQHRHAPLVVSIRSIYIQ